MSILWTKDHLTLKKHSTLFFLTWMKFRASCWIRTPSIIYQPFINAVCISDIKEPTNNEHTPGLRINRMDRTANTHKKTHMQTKKSCQAEAMPTGEVKKRKIWSDQNNGQQVTTTTISAPTIYDITNTPTRFSNNNAFWKVTTFKHRRHQDPTTKTRILGFYHEDQFRANMSNAYSSLPPDLKIQDLSSIAAITLHHRATTSLAHLSRGSP